MISPQPSPSSQGDEQSPFLPSAAICMFEAQACPTSAAAREAARVHADFEVCRGISGDVNLCSPYPTCSDRPDRTLSDSKGTRHHAGLKTSTQILPGGPEALSR